jgi:hypothetical protein
MRQPMRNVGEFPHLVHRISPNRGGAVASRKEPAAHMIGTHHPLVLSELKGEFDE